MSGPDSLGVGARRFLCHPGALCRGPALSASGPGPRCVGPQRSLCRGCGGLLLFVMGPGALCVGPRRSLCRAPALSVSGPGALCVGPWRSLRRGPAGVRLNHCYVFIITTYLGRSIPFRCGIAAPAMGINGTSPAGRPASLSRGPALSPSLCRDLCWAPALSVSGPGPLCVGPSMLSVSDPAALSLSVSGPSTLCVGAGALCVGPRHSLCRGPGALCIEPRHSFAVCVGPRHSLSLFVVGPGPAAQVRLIRMSPIRSTRAPNACSPIRAPSSDARQLRSTCHPSSPARSFFPGENPNTVWGMMLVIIIRIRICVKVHITVFKRAALLGTPNHRASTSVAMQFCKRQSTCQSGNPSVKKFHVSGFQLRVQALASNRGQLITFSLLKGLADLVTTCKWPGSQSDVSDFGAKLRDRLESLMFEGCIVRSSCVRPSVVLEFQKNHTSTRISDVLRASNSPQARNAP